MPTNSRAIELNLIEESSVADTLRVILVTILASALAISGFTLFLRWRLTPQLALLAGVSSLVALVLSRSGRIKPAMMLPMLSIIYAVMHLAARSDGIQNIGLAILPVLIVVCGLVLDRLTLVFLTGGVIFATGGMLAIRYFVLRAERYSTNDMGDLFIFAITCATAALVGQMFASRIKEGFNRAQTYCRALGVAERNARLIADSLSEMVVAYDTNRNLTYANSGAEKLTGYGLAELQVAAPLFWAHPEDRPRVVALWDKVFDGEAVDQVVYRLITKDGTVKWVMGSWGPVTDEEGNQIGIRGTCQNITERMVAGQLLEEATQKFRTIVEEMAERKRAEAALRKSEDRLRFAQKVASIGTFDWNIETGVNTWTPELEAMYGLPQGGFSQTQTAWEELVHPDDRARAVQRVKGSFETGAPVEEEWRVIRPDGSVRWLAGRWQVLKDEAGKPLRMMGVNIDVTDRKQMEESLRQSEERFRLAITATNDAIWDIDLKTGTVSWNETYSTLYGRPLETSDSWQWWIDRIQPEDRDCTVDGLRRAISSGASSWTCEYRFQRADGEWAYIYDRAYIARDSAGAAWRVIGAMQDLTERKRVEAALLDSEERFRATFSQAAVGMAQTSTDGNWLLLNHRFCEILGYSQAELCGKAFLQFTHPDDRDASRTAFRRLLAAEISSLSMEKRYIHKDGSTVWARVSISLVRGEDSQPLYFISVVEDITEKIQAERALQEAQQRLALAQSAAQLGVWERDLRTNVIVLSGEYARLYGLPPERTQLTHEEWLNLIHPDDRERMQAQIRESLERTYIWDAEFRVVWPDGSIHWLLVKGTVFLDDASRPIHTTGVSMDVTDRKQATAELRAKERQIAHMNRVGALGELTASLAHELNQPLAAILSNAQAASRFLSAESTDLTQVRECLTDIVADDKRAGEVIKRLWDLLKKGKSEATQVDLNAVVNDVVRLLQSDTMLRRVSIAFKPSSHLPAVLGDRVQLYQVVLNLIMNAVEASGEQVSSERWVEIRTGSRGGTIELAVEDSGKGIGESDLTRVFDPFFTTKPEGLGMGLSISRSIVRAHGGRLWAENRASGGAVFRCFLPAAQQAGAAAGVSASMQQRSVNTLVDS